jgi:hypothetical protein
MRRLCVLVLTLALPACSSDEGFAPVGPSGPTIPTIGGSYSSPDLYRFDLSGGTGPTNFICGGVLTIGTQIATSFSGTFVLNDQRCGSVSGTITAGTYASDGSISFELTVPGTNSNFLTAAFGCTYVSGDRGLTGTLVRNQLNARAETVMNCGTDGVRTVVTNVSGAQ